jgi:lipoprotein-releasing system ATP-binding protein
LLKRLHHQHGLTSLIVTHNPAFARRCQRVLRMAKAGVEEVAPESLVAG